ncbi:MAG TPA: peptidylprolyl isomerase [Thermoanaerobaculia bacterium]|nr:peptidylprolyl isomerase [Thermoanaerobaculia bacterium]
MARRRSIALVVAAALLAALPAGAASANRIIARVNDRIATLYDFEVRLEDSLRRADLPESVSGRQAYLTELARDVMKELFEELLVLSRADQLGITVTRTEVTEAIQRMRQANGLEDDQEFRQALAQTGLDPEQLRSQFEQQMRFQRVIGREVYSEVKLEEEDLRRYYRDHLEEFRQPEAVKLREIVVLDDTGTDPAAEAEASRLAQELAAGRPLEEVVAGAVSAKVSEVIELGWVESGDLAPALEQAVWSLEPGAWSEPTRSRGGVHLAQVVDRKESVIPSFKEIEPEIRAREERVRLNQQLKSYLSELEAKSFLYLDPPPEAAGFRTASGEIPLNVEFPLMPPASEGSPAKGRARGAADAVEDAEAAVEREIEDDLRQAPEEEIDLKPLPEDLEGPDGLPTTTPR